MYIQAAEVNFKVVGTIKMVYKYGTLYVFKSYKNVSHRTNKSEACQGQGEAIA
jgi:hypothetical protein